MTLAEIDFAATPPARYQPCPEAGGEGIQSRHAESEGSRCRRLAQVLSRGDKRSTARRKSYARQLDSWFTARAQRFGLSARRSVTTDVKQRVRRSIADPGSPAAVSDHVSLRAELLECESNGIASDAKVAGERARRWQSRARCQAAGQDSVTQPVVYLAVERAIARRVEVNENGWRVRRSPSFPAIDWTRHYA